ncbi:MAG: non-heme iron oxygenase ferredoxin subunit [Candidatus Palauibacterales bacterium]|nr:non-heme iron oxygenase ferredoxin subunit [Candidatus Palauibacterales bacterium]
MSEFTTVATVDDLSEGELMGVEVDGREIVLANRGGTVYALEDCCSHEEFPLSDGEITGDQLTCALHGARFDLETGEAKALPAVMPVDTFECRVEGDEIQVKVGD